MNKHNKIYLIIDDTLLSHESELICIIECNSHDVKKTKHIRRMSSVPSEKKYNIFSITELAKKYRKSQKIDIITPIIHTPTYIHK